MQMPCLLMCNTHLRSRDVRSTTGLLKTLDTISVIVKDQASHLIYHNICRQTNLYKFKLNWFNEQTKTPLSLEVVFSQTLDFETSKSNSEVSK